MERAEERGATAQVPADVTHARRSTRLGESVLGNRRSWLVDGTLAVLLLALAAYVRWPGLGTGSLSFADTWVAIITHLDDPGDVITVGVTAPGFTMLAKLWFTIFGFSPTGAQIPAFVFGSLTPGLGYLVARRLPVGPVPALGAGVLLALSPVHISHSVMLKQYTLDALLVLVLVWLALGVMSPDADDGPTRLIVLVCACIAATLSSASVAPVAVSAVAGGALSIWRRNAGRGSAVLAVAGYSIVAGAWALHLSSRVPAELTDYWSGFYVDGPADLARASGALADGLGIGGPAVVFGVITLATAAWVAYRDPPLGVVLAGPLVIAIALAVLERVPIGTGRTDIYLYPILALGAAWLLQHALPSVRSQSVLVGLLVIALLPIPAPRYPADPGRPLIESLEEQRQDGDRIVANYGILYSLALYGPWMDGLVTGIPTVRGFMPRFDDPTITGIERQDTPEEMTAAVRRSLGGERVWVLFTPRTQPWTGDAIAAAMVEGGYALTSEQSNRAAVLQLWER